MKLSIIIPVKNDAHGLARCLNSIQAAANPTSYEVIVVDNGSTDNSVAVAKSYGASVMLAPDLGIAALRNLGVSGASGDYLAFLDADCSVSNNWFESIFDYLEEGSIACFGCPPVPPANATWVQKCWYQIRKKRLYGRKVFEVDWLESMNLFVKRDLFLSLSGFDEELTTCEDVDFCRRLSNNSPVTCDNRIIAVHYGEAKTVWQFYKKERWRGTSNWQNFRKHGFEKSERPSVFLPVLQVVILFAAIAACLLAMYNVIPAYFVGGLLVLWQVPLLLLSLSKSEPFVSIKMVGGLWVLLNVYFLARGVSLYKNAPWTEPQNGRFESGMAL